MVNKNKDKDYIDVDDVDDVSDDVSTDTKKKKKGEEEDEDGEEESSIDKSAGSSALIEAISGKKNLLISGGAIIGGYLLFKMMFSGGDTAVVPPPPVTQIKKAVGPDGRELTVEVAPKDENLPVIPVTPFSPDFITAPPTPPSLSEPELPPLPSDLFALTPKLPEKKIDTNNGNGDTPKPGDELAKTAAGGSASSGSGKSAPTAGGSAPPPPGDLNTPSAQNKSGSSGGSGNGGETGSGGDGSAGGSAGSGQNNAGQQPTNNAQPTQIPNMFIMSGGSGGSSFNPSSSRKGDSKTSKNDFIVVGGNVSMQTPKESKELKTEKIGNLETTIGQGKFIEAVLETAINSTLPGTVRGIVSKDVYGENGRKILIPKGTRLFGEYQSQVKRGQDRVLINWSRMLRPDGVSISLEAQAADQFGRVGIEGVADNKYSELFGSSLLFSLITLTTGAIAQRLSKNNNGITQIFTPQSGTVANLQVRPIDIATQQFVQNTSQLAKDVITEMVDTQPVIRVEQGTRITVSVKQDLEIAPYYKTDLR